jgi:RNA polymerase sigma-70 factor (ECF subfamily)
LEQDLKTIQAVLAGDREAYRLLVDRYKGKVYGVIYRLVQQADLAEEITQDAFVKAYLGLSRFRHEASFCTWVTQIGIHRARDHARGMRRARRRARLVSLDEMREAGRLEADPADQRQTADPAHAIRAREDRAQLQEALARLPAEYRLVLILKHLAGWSYERIAEQTGETVGALKVRAHRARRLLGEQKLPGESSSWTA